MAKRKLKMNFAGRFIDLLGQQMYGGPVPSVAELIANAWDADADKVEVIIPENLTAKRAEITVRDYGRGMSFDEVNDHYLNIGYERRVRGERTKKGRLIMGRKGIGKLAGFGIAEDIIIQSIQSGHLVQFDLNYSKLKKQQSLEAYEFVPDRDEASKEPDGVTVIYRNLKAKQNLNIEEFKKSMARRFALETGKMTILVNNEPISPEDLDFEFRVPAAGWQEEEVQGFGRVKYWFGFLNNTVQDPELRGVSVFARDRIAQVTPFFFNLSGGINGQVGLEYFTGQLKSDILDGDFDYVATDRQTVNWQFSAAPILERWGQAKIKELCREWKKRRDEKKRDKFMHDYSELNPLIKPLPEQERKDLIDALDKIAVLDRIEEGEFMVIAQSMVSGVQRESVRKVIRRIKDTDENAVDELYQAIKEWDVLSAVSLAEVVQGKIEIIEQFEKHIDARLPEKKKGGLDMQTFIKQHPWLLGQEYEYLKPADFHHERGVDRWIEEVLHQTEHKLPKTGKKGEARRFDLLCLLHDQRIVILELMRPGEQADYDHATRLFSYVTNVEAAAVKATTKGPFSNKTVYGLLIADGFADDPVLQKFLQTNRNVLDAVEWKTLFRDVQGRYREFLEILKTKAPDDPRIKGLVELDKKHEI